MSSPYNYKLIIGSISKDDSILSKALNKPVFFNTLEEAKIYLHERKQALQQDGRKLWFYKVWEFGKEEYMDMGNIFKIK